MKSEPRLIKRRTEARIGPGLPEALRGQDRAGEGAMAPHWGPRARETLGREAEGWSGRARASEYARREAYRVRLRSGDEILSEKNRGPS